MNEAPIKKRLFIILGLLALVGWSWLPSFGGAEGGSSACPEEVLCVVFLDVGQGDATFIQSPSGTQMLIDGGRSSVVLGELGKVMGFWDKDIDYVVATHPDADHVGGLIDVLERYEVKNVVRTENESDTPTWQTAEEGISTENAEVYFARRGQIYDLDAGVSLEILFPDVDPSELESNTASIVAKLSYGEVDFLLTGDSPKAIEEYLVLAEGEALQSEVLKVGHHGSRTSTSEMFLNEVLPDYAVISAGADNSYGHPHVEVTDMLFNYDVATYSTAESGSVMFLTNGTDIEIR